MKKRKVAGPLKDLYRQSACQANQLATDIFTAADTQVAQDMRQKLESGDYLGIVSASIDPLNYGLSSVDTFSRDYLCVEMMSKFPSWEIGVDRPAVALQKFLEVEDGLKELKFFPNHRIVCGVKSATMHAVIHTACNKISKILGELSLDEVHRSFAFGPGASTSLPRRCGDAAYKFGASRPQLSYNALPLVSALAKAHPTWRLDDAEVVAGSKLITVPKNAKTDRTICIEPDLNMYLQKGLGKVIRRRLQRWGLLKPTAQEYNQELAREGSAYGRLATVDLSSASDSIHLGLVDQLLPPVWADLVGLMRSPQTVLPSEESILLRKVSSMGNGFTFELETLIFYGLCRAVIDHFATEEMDHRCTVFGDDIIIDKGLVPALREVFSIVGFVMNPKKTFTDGLFRESCGKHYFAGNDVTPFYIRAPIDSVLRKYWAANTVKRYAALPWGLDSRYEPAYRNIVASIPSYYQGFKIPDGVGDGGLISDWDEVRPSRNKNGHDSWRYVDIVQKTKNIDSDQHGTLLKCLHNLEISGSGLEVDSQAPISKTIGVLDSFRRSFIADYLGPTVAIDNEGLEDFVLVRDGLGKRGRGVIPRALGHRKHVGYARQWPSFGPWI